MGSTSRIVISVFAAGVLATTLMTAQAGSAGSAGVFAAAPEPSPVPRRWQLELDFTDLRVMTVETDEGPQPYFYLTYTVTNDSGEDILFAPRWELATDEGDLLRSGRHVPLSVTQHILEVLENPYLESQVEISGPLLQGEGNARDGLVVWPVTDADPDLIQVFGAGFSGETATVEVPDPKTRQTKRVVLRKTFEVDYVVNGELNLDSATPLTRAGTGRSRWIMR
jgi:hypothetical protein